MTPALEVPADIDLRLFSAYLTQQGVRHRITEEGVNQVVWVAAEAQRVEVQRYYALVANGQLVLETADGQRSAPASLTHRIAVNLNRFPLTMALVLLNFALFPVTSGTVWELKAGLFAQMTLLPFDVVGGQLVFLSLDEALASGDWWRLLTPMFLHFGWLHIVFNLLWTWEIGRRLELNAGTSTLLLVVLTSSLAANLLQYLFYGAGLFGGMSGVVFGLLGFCMVWDRLVPSRRSGLPQGIFYFMLGFLALGFTGLFDLLGLGSLANGAHLGGLLGGLLTGAIAALLSRLFDEAA